MVPDLDEAGVKARPVLGQGVWGTVLDMQDASVLKLTRRKGGIGDGVAKAKREIAILEALEQRKQYFRALSFPRLLARREIDPASNLGRQGYAYAMRLSKMSAPFMSGRRFESMTAAQKERFVMSLAEAMAEFHDVFAARPMEPLPAPSARETGLRELKNYTPRQDDHAAADFLAGKFKDAFSRASLVFGHGDLNFGNMAVAEDGAVEGFIDFAETSYTLPEAELSHFLTEQDFTKDVIARYERVTGQKLQEEFLNLSAASNALFGAVICEFCTNEKEEAAQCRLWLPRHLAELGY